MTLTMLALKLDDLCPKKLEEIAQELDKATRNGIDALAQYLSVEDISCLFKKAIQILKKEPTVVDLEFTDPEMKVTVVGDTHGQFHDVLKMFQVAGNPNQISTFVLNGDFVDRGAWGLETLVLFVCWKLTFPQNVYLLRGNHESQLLTELYGFKAEVQAKYSKSQSRTIYSISKKLFAELPLAAVIQQNTLVLHGGLFRTVPRRTGKKRKKVARTKVENIQLGSVAFLRNCSKGGIEPTRMTVSSAISDVLWSDPQPEHGITENTARGLGLTFGPDMTNQFLEENNLKLVIRSHEGPDARQYRDGMSDMMTGFAIDHETEHGNLVTVFSAPDYPQFQDGNARINNSASVVVLTAPDYATPTTLSFTAVLPRPPATVFYDMELYVETDIDFNDVYPEYQELDEPVDPSPPSSNEKVEETLAPCEDTEQSLIVKTKPNEDKSDELAPSGSTEQVLCSEQDVHKEENGSTLEKE